MPRVRPYPAQHIESHHALALRQGRAYLFTADIPGIPIGTSAFVRFTTGDTAIMFTSSEILISEEKVELRVYEDSVFSAPGVLNLTYIRNENRMSTRVSLVEPYDGPTITNNGTVILHDRILGVASQGAQKPGFGTAAGNNNLLLKPNAEHLFEVANQSGSAVDVLVHFFYHESDPTEYTDAP